MARKSKTQKVKEEVKETKEVKTEEPKVYKVHDDKWEEVMGTKQLRVFAVNQARDYLECANESEIRLDILSYVSKDYRNGITNLLEDIKRGSITMNDITDKEAIELLKLKDFDVDKLFIE